MHRPSPAVSQSAVDVTMQFGRARLGSPSSLSNQIAMPYHPRPAKWRLRWRAFATTVEPGSIIMPLVQVEMCALQHMHATPHPRNSLPAHGQLPRRFRAVIGRARRTRGTKRSALPAHGSKRLRPIHTARIPAEQFKPIRACTTAGFSRLGPPDS